LDRNTLIMSIYSVRVSAKGRAARASIAAVAMFCVMSTARADDCAQEATQTSESDFSPCEIEMPQLDLDSALADHTATLTRSKTPDSTPWIAQGNGNVPLAVNPSDTGVSMRASLATWRDFNQRAAVPTIDTPSWSAPPVLTLPKAPPAAKTPIDVWSSVDVQGYEGAGQESMRAGVGADYKVGHATTVGVAAEHGDVKGAAGTGTEQDAKMAAYVTLQAAPMLSLDARTEWQAGNAEFAAATGAAEKSALIISPKLNHSFALDGGKTIEPFVTYKRELDMSEAGRESVATGVVATQSAGAGVTYTNPDAYSLSVTTDVQGLGAAQPADVNGKFQLSVPIR
jgi:hypothetical protein